MQPVRKAVIPAAGLGTRFLPATKSSPKEMLPVVDKPAIQYVVEEAVQAGLTDILIITGRNKRAVEDHFDRNFELEHYLEATGQARAAEGSAVRVRPRRHPLRPPARSARSRARGVGRAPSRRSTSRSRCCSPTTSWSTTPRCCGRCSTCTTRTGRSVVAVQEVSPEEISSYGCVEPDACVTTTALVEIQRIVEKPRARRRAVEPRGHRPLRVHARDLRRARPHRARARRRAATHRRDRAAARASRRVFGCVCSDGRYDVGQKLDFLRANVELALDRPDLGPALAEMAPRACVAARERARVIPLADAQAMILDAVAPLAPRRSRSATRVGLVLAEARHRARAGAAVREHRDGRLRRARRPTPPGAPVRLRVVGELAGRAVRRRSRSARAKAIRIMTGAPMPDGADAIVMVERTQRRRRHRRDRRRPPTPAITCAPPAATSRPGQRCSTRARCSRPRTSACSRASTSREIACHPRPRVGVCRPATSSSRAARSRRGASATRTARCCSRCSRKPAANAVDCGIARDDEHGSTRAIARARRRVRRAADERRGVDGRLRLREGRARAVAKRAAASFAWTQIAIKPAKPLAFAAIGGVPVFGLPGNPVSSRVSFELFARPALRKLAGRADRARRPGARRPRATAFAGGPTASCTSTGCASRVEDGRYVCERAGFQASNVLSGMAAANGLALIPDGDGVAAGEAVAVLLLGAVGAMPITVRSDPPGRRMPRRRVVLAARFAGTAEPAVCGRLNPTAGTRQLRWAP